MSSAEPFPLVASPDLPPRWQWKRWAIVAGVAVMIWWVAANRTAFSVESLVAHEAVFRRTYRQHPIAVWSMAFGMYLAMTGLSVPGASVLSLAFGWLFGFWPALVLVSFSSSLGATIACGLSRTLFRDAAARRLGSRLRLIEESLARDGDFYLLTLRLLPQVPFFLVNLAMGLTRYPLWRFYGISQLGMLPATCVFVYAGSRAVDLQALKDQGPGSLLTPELVLALCLLAFIPWILRSVVRWVRPRVSDTVAEGTVAEGTSSQHD